MLVQPAASSPIWLVICWLAAWRITMLLCYEAGPFDIFSRLRVGLARIGLHRLITCFYCASFWVSAAVVLTVYEFNARSVLLVFGVAGAAALTERFRGELTNEKDEGDG